MCRIKIGLRKKMVFAVIMVAFLLAWQMPAFAEEAKGEYKVAVAQGSDYGACTAIDQNQPDAMGLQKGKLELANADHSVVASLLQIELPPAIEPDQIEAAYLYLRSVDDENVSSFQAHAIRNSWNMVSASWNSVFQNIDDKLVSGDVKKEADAWYRVDITTIVKAWFGGDVANYGLFLSMSENGKEGIFYSPFDEDVSNSPRIEIQYHEKKTDEAYGKYGYTFQEDGNCFSYALRDLDGIYYQALIKDTPEFQGTYDLEGIEGALAYVKQQCLDYIKRHEHTLSVEGIRELESYDQAIDPKREYVIGMRIGFRERNGITGIQVDEEFDYHFKVLLADGTWSEKTPAEGSRIVPGTNASYRDIGKYPWDQGYMWGYEKWNDYYTSDVVYLAIEKTTDQFTSHLGTKWQDVKGHWAQEYIVHLADSGVISGYGDEFRPNDSATRAELVAMINRMLHLQGTNEVAFMDVPEDAWYYQDFAQLKSAGIIAGYENGKMRPLDNVTRQEAVVMIAHAFGIEGKDDAIGKFQDMSDISSWAIKLVNGMESGGYIKGDEKGLFHPHSNITRAEIAAILDRMI